MLDKNTETHIVLLYIHKHRVNDLKNWLKSLGKVNQLHVALIVSNNTVCHVEPLLETDHSFEIFNIEEEVTEIKMVESSFALMLLWKEFARSYSNFKRLYNRAKKILLKHKDAVLVTYDDRISSLLPILKASSELGIPVFLPAMLTTRPDLSATTSNTLKPKRKVESLIAFFIKKIYPNHFDQDGRLFYEALHYLVLLWFGAMPKNPWVKGTLSYTSKLGVESFLAYQKLLEAGVEKNKLELTGMPVYDLMDFSRNEQCSEKLLLCALPQYGEHGAMTVEQALPIIEEILLSFKSFAGNVVVSLHPRMKPEIYQSLVEKQGFKCVVGNVDVWLKKASLFFAASSSTTIYSSLLMGIPTIALNHIKPYSNIYRDFSSLVYIEQGVDISTEISAVILNSKRNLKELMRADEQLLSRALVTDGKCGERSLNIIQKLLKFKETL